MAALTSQEYVDAHSGGGGSGELSYVNNSNWYTSGDFADSTLSKTFTPGSSKFASLGLEDDKLYILDFKLRCKFEFTASTVTNLGASFTFNNPGYSSGNKVIKMASIRSDTTEMEYEDFGQIVAKGSKLKTLTCTLAKSGSTSNFTLYCRSFNFEVDLYSV